MRLEGWAATWFETRSFAALLTMRPGNDSENYDSL